MNPKLTTGAELLGTWLADVEHGEPPARFKLNSPFASLDVRPGRLFLFGAPPGAGKTAALLQMGIDLLRLNDTAKLLIANVEMPPVDLLERIVARMSGVNLTQIMNRELNVEDKQRIRAAVRTLETVATRFAFMGPPFTLEHVAACGTAFNCNALVLDYLQRFTVGTTPMEQRERLDSVVSGLRAFCNAGLLVLCAAAVARQKNGNGSTYAGLNLASFRGSSELEFGADACYLLIRDEDGADVEFQCEKNRYGPTENFRTVFNPALQSFELATATSPLDRFDQAKPARPHRKRPKGD